MKRWKLLLLLLSLSVAGLVYANTAHFTETLPQAQSYGTAVVSNGYDWTAATLPWPAPSTVSMTALSTQITPSSNYIVLSPNNVAIGGALTAIPTISTSTLGANGGPAYPDGTFIVVTGTSSVTSLRLQDNATLSGSRLNIGTGAAYVTVSSSLTATFVYNAAATSWNYVGASH